VAKEPFDIPPEKKEEVFDFLNNLEDMEDIVRVHHNGEV
jgi:transcriptional/translational regulatory protein YebC/TACO1